MLEADKLNMNKSKSKIFFYSIIFSFVFLLFSGSAQAATLFLSPSSKNVDLGETFSVSVFVNAGSQSINNSEATVSFPADLLNVQSISKAGSIFSMWIQDPSYSNSSGNISYNGGVPNPGFSGASGKVMTITFVAKKSGTASIIFSSGSILANDGLGTGVFTGSAGAKINISAPAPKEEKPAPTVSTIEKDKPTQKNTVPVVPQVSSGTNPDPEKWYKNRSLEVSWNLPAGTNGESMYFSQSPNSNLSSISDGLSTSKIYENVSDGVWYFHIKFRNQSGWGETTHFRFQVDATPPKPFDIEIISAPEAEDYQVKLTSEGEDELSGIAYYTLEYGDQNSIRLTPNEIGVNTPYNLSGLASGRQQIKVSAYDQAGNVTSVSKNFIVASRQGPKIDQQNAPAANISAGVGLIGSDSSGLFSFSGKLFETGSWIIKFLILAILLLALLLLLSFIVLYSWHKFSKLNIKASEEIRLAKKAFQKEFAKSQKDIQQRIEILEKNRVRRQKVENAERKILEHLKQELAEIEKSKKVIKGTAIKKKNKI